MNTRFCLGLFWIVWLLINVSAHAADCESKTGKQPGDLVVPENACYIVLDANIVGALIMKPGSRLLIRNSTIGRDLIAEKPAALRINLGTLDKTTSGAGESSKVVIQGSLIIEDADFTGDNAGAICDGSTVGKNVVIRGGKGKFLIGTTEWCHKPRVQIGGKIQTENSTMNIGIGQTLVEDKCLPSPSVICVTKKKR